MHRIFVSIFGFRCCFFVFLAMSMPLAAGGTEIIRVGSLNVNLMPVREAFRADGHTTGYKDRLAGFGKVTTMKWFDGTVVHQKLDIIGYQEAWRGSPVGDAHYVALRSRLEDAGFARRNILRGTGKGFERGWHHGLVIASRFPIEETAEMTFWHKAGWDFLHEKGVLFARVNVNGTRVAVFNTHLQAPDGKTTYRKVREKQLRQLRKFLSKHARRGEPIIIMGDFNIEQASGCPSVSEYCSWMRGEQGGHWNDFINHRPKVTAYGLDYLISAGPGASTVTARAYEGWVYVDAEGNPELVEVPKINAPPSTAGRQKITDHPLIYGVFEVSKE